PGRFDRQVTVNLPDVRGREAILKVHAKNVKLSPSVDLSVIARGTPGYSGAELANLLNEAALLAASENKKAVTMEELEEARDKVRWGRERRSLAMTDEDKKFTAWHEAGHALVNVVLQHTHPLHKVTIIPRGQSLGSTMSLPKTDILNRRRKEMLELIAKSLLEYETLDGQQVDEIVRTGKFTPPPPTPHVDLPMGAPAGTPLPEAPSKPAPPKLPGLGTPAPAAA